MHNLSHCWHQIPSFAKSELNICDVEDNVLVMICCLYFGDTNETLPLPVE